MADNDETIDRLFNAGDDAWEEGDEAKAFGFFKQAAELGDGDALVELAKINIAGQGVPKDEAKARQYLEKALALPVDNGEDDAEIDVDQPFISLAGHEEAVEILAGMTR
jgi:TPR repeat protein